MEKNGGGPVEENNGIIYERERERERENESNHGPTGYPPQSRHRSPPPCRDPRQLYIYLSCVM